MSVIAVVRPGVVRWMELDPIGWLLTRSPARPQSIDTDDVVVFVDPMLDEPHDSDGATLWLPEIPDDADQVILMPVPIT